MPSLIELPTELRQQILVFALPETTRIESAVPTQFFHLFQINQRLRHDMNAIASIWTPMHYVSQPSTLTSRAPRTRGWNCSRMCLDLFYTSFLGRIAYRSMAQNAASYSHPELMSAWIDAVPFLPREITEVWLDVTPAPAEKRVHHPKWLECGPPWFDLFVHSDNAARRFLGAHVQDVAALVRKLDERYGGQVRVKLSGRLSVKSAFFVQRVGQEVGREIGFVGTWVSNEDVLTASVSSRLLCRMAREQGRCGTHTMAWLANVAWSKETGDVYAEIADQDPAREWTLVEDVKVVAEFRESGGEGILMLPPENNLRRAFQHRFAADLKLKSVEAGEGYDRHVVVQW